MSALCYCCAGTGRIEVGVRPLCATAIGRRDTRSPRMLAILQQHVLRGIAYDDHGGLLPEHGQPYVCYETGQVRA